MRLRFACATCEQTVATAEIALPVVVPCPRCQAATSFARPSGHEGHIERCLTCGGRHLFLQKEFPRRLGLAITTVGAALFLVLMGFERIFLGFAALLSVALIDAIIYRLAPLMTVCYHCQTEFRRGLVNPDHGAYDPKIAFYTAKKSRPRGAALEADAEGGNGGRPAVGQGPAPISRVPAAERLPERTDRPVDGSRPEPGGKATSA